MRIFYDVDTQNDFMNSDGALYVPGAEEIKPNLRRLTEIAKQKKIPIVGSVDRHFPNDSELKRNGGPFPDHCMDGSLGQDKSREVYLEHALRMYGTANVGYNAVFIENETDTDGTGIVNKPRVALGFAKAFAADYDSQGSKYSLMFEKQHYDVFTNPAADYFFKIASVTEAVVYGVATDFCVKAAVLGMQKRGVQCYVVTDAIKGVFPDKSREALEAMTAAGAKMVQMGELEKMIERGE